jgi:hypothetical protein
VQNSLKTITKWFRDSGLSVNKRKTELCVFSKRDKGSVSIIFDNKIIIAKQGKMFLESCLIENFMVLAGGQCNQESQKTSKYN